MQQLTPLQAFEKIKHYCVYQGRCHQEVRNKLYEYGLTSKDVEGIIVQLIEENLLNEERFAFSYVSGKVNIKKWGINKIKYQLKSKGISSYIINKAIASIVSETYDKNLEELISQKQRLMKKERQAIMQLKLLQFLLSKGYEASHIQQSIKRHFEK